MQNTDLGAPQPGQLRQAQLQHAQLQHAQLQQAQLQQAQLQQAVGFDTPVQLVMGRFGTHIERHGPALPVSR
ncbi:MAG: pentapeptide repeat-containing protein [Candidatus Xenobia bacterium]